MDTIPRSTLSAQDWFSYSTFWVSVWILRFFSISMKKMSLKFWLELFDTDLNSATSFNNATLPNAPKEWPTGSGLFKCSNAQDLWGHLLGVGYSSVQMPKTYGDISFKPLFLFFIFPLLLSLIPSISFPGPSSVVLSSYMSFYSPLLILQPFPFLFLGLHTFNHICTHLCTWIHILQARLTYEVEHTVLFSWVWITLLSRSTHFFYK